MLGNITGWEPLDMMIMQSAQDADKVIAEIRRTHGEEDIDDILLNLGLSFEDFQLFDAQRIANEYSRYGARYV